jgi:hypothetical protein
MTSRTALPILRTLREQPLLSREQLQTILGSRQRTLQWRLAKLNAAQWIRVINARVSDVPQRMYVLTRAGLCRLAESDGMSLPSYAEAYGYHVARLERLILVLDRAYRVRAFLLQLKNATWDWSVVEWNVEVELEFSTARYDLRFDCHGITRLQNAQGRWITLVVECDLGKVPVPSQRARLARLVEGIADQRFSAPEENAFPALVILAANQPRLFEYQTLLNQLEYAFYQVPHTFLTTQQWWMESGQNPTALIWKTEREGNAWVALLDDIVGGTQDPAHYLPWERLPRARRFSERSLELQSLPPGTLLEHNRHHLAALSLTLRALDKTLLALIGDHPLLDAVEMAQIKPMPVRSIRRGLERLGKWGLVEARTHPQRLETHQPSRAERQKAKARCYILTEKGLWMLAAWAGFGLSVETYARVRGWKKRFGELVYHWDHTRLENAVYVQFAREARRRGHRVCFWLSELEARIYFDTSYEYYSRHRYHRTRRGRRRKDASHPTPFGDWGIERQVGNRQDFSRALAQRGHELQSFLPDGRGAYQTDEQTHLIAVEIDCGRANHDKLWQKFNYYLRLIDADAQSAWRILIITTGWQRAAHIADLVVRRALAGAAYQEYRHLRGEPLIARLTQAGMLDIALRDLLPVYVTIADALREQGIASPIWLSAEDAMNGVSTPSRYCLECFEPETR